MRIGSSIAFALAAFALLLAAGVLEPGPGPLRGSDPPSLAAPPTLDGNQLLAGKTWIGNTQSVEPTAGPVPTVSAAHDFAWGNATVPPVGPLSGSGLAADSALREAVLFGGTNGTSSSNQTLVYNESTDRWSNAIAVASPSARSHFAIAGDARTGVAVLFGGAANGTAGRVLSDTWAFHFAARKWTNVTHPLVPAARQDAGFALAPALGIGLLFGGWDQNFSGRGALIYGDTWTVNLTTYVWTNVVYGGAAHPPPLEGAALAWDPVSSEFELFGGCFPCNAVLWGFSPSAGHWKTVVASGASPLARGSASWGYDPAQQKEVLFGGLGGLTALNDTYEFNPVTSTWTRQNEALIPASRYAAAAAWMDDPSNETLLMTGGRGTTSTVAPDLLRLAPTSNLSIRVFNGSNHLPISNASVSVDGGPPVFTTAHGYRNLTQVNPTEVKLSTFAPGYALDNLSTWITPGTEFHLAVNLTPVPPANLTVLVLTSVGLPVAGAFVNVTIEGRPFLNPGLQTDSTGQATYFGIPTAPVNVSAWAPFYYQNGTRVNLVSGQTVFVSIPIVPYAEAHVTVLGYFPPNGESIPLFGVRVTADGNLLGATDLIGRLDAPAGPSGFLLFAGTAPGFREGTAYANVPYTGDVYVNLTLYSLPFGVVSILVLDSVTHAPVILATANMTAAPGSPTEGLVEVFTSNSLGFANSSLPPNNYTTVVWRAGYFANGSLGSVSVASSGFDEYTVNLTPAPGRNSAGSSSGPFSLFPVDQAVAWPFLLIPAFLLVAGAAYLVLLRGETPLPLRRRPPSPPVLAETTVGTPVSPPPPGP